MAVQHPPGSDVTVLILGTFAVAVLGVAVFWLFLSRGSAEQQKKKQPNHAHHKKPKPTEAPKKPLKPLDEIPSTSVSKKKREKKKRAAANKAKLQEEEAKREKEEPASVELELPVEVVEAPVPVEEEEIEKEDVEEEVEEAACEEVPEPELEAEEEEPIPEPELEPESEPEPEEEAEDVAALLEARQEEEAAERQRVGSAESEGRVDVWAEWSRWVKSILRSEVERKERISREAEHAKEHKDRKAKLDKFFTDIKRTIKAAEAATRTSITSEETTARQTLHKTEVASIRKVTPRPPQKQPEKAPISPTEASLPILCGSNGNSKVKGIYRPPANGKQDPLSPQSRKNDTNSAPCSPILTPGEISYVLRKGQTLKLSSDPDGILKLMDVPSRHAREKGVREGMLVSTVEGVRPEPGHRRILQQGGDRDIVVVFTQPAPPPDLPPTHQMTVPIPQAPQAPQAPPPPPPPPAPPVATHPIPPQPVAPHMPTFPSPNFYMQPFSTHLPSLPQHPLPMCKKDKLCQDINDPEHQKDFRHTCKIKDCAVSDCDWHTMYFHHEAPSADEWNGEISVVDVDEHKRLLMKGNWAKVKVGKLKQLISKNLGIQPAVQHITTKDGIPLVNDGSTCKEYSIKAGSSVYVTRNAVGGAPSTPTAAQPLPTMPIQPQLQQAVPQTYQPVPLPHSTFVQPIYNFPGATPYPTNGLVRTGQQQQQLPQSQFAADASKLYQAAMPHVPLPYATQAKGHPSTTPVVGRQGADDSARWASGISDAFHYS